MAAGKRREGESFEDYRERLRAEAKAEKHRSKGRWFWISSIVVPDFLRPGRLRKLKVRGTYVKAR
jgi:hypothetical protein